MYFNFQIIFYRIVEFSRLTHIHYLIECVDHVLQPFLYVSPILPTNMTHGYIAQHLLKSLSVF